MSELNAFYFSKMMAQIKKAGQKFQIVLTFFNKLRGLRMAEMARV